MRDHPRVRGVDAADVREDLAAIRTEGGRQGDGRRVAAAATQRGDLAVPDGGGALALEAGHDDDPAVGDLLAHPARFDVGDAGPAVAAVRRDAGLRPGQADRRDAQAMQGHRQQGRALVLAGRQQDVELARVRIVRDGGREAEQLVRGVAHRRDDDDEVVAGGALAGDPTGDPLDAVGVGHGGAAELLDDEGGGQVRHRRGHSTVRESRAPPTYDGDATHTRIPRRMPMCFDLDSRPPIVPIAGGALDSATADPDRRRRRDVRRVPGPGDRPDRCRDHRPARRPRPASVLRGAGPAVRGARRRCRRHRLLRADGRRTSLARDDFEYMPHVSQTTWAGLGADVRAAAADLRSPAGGSVRSLFTIGFCMGGRLSFLAATLGLDLAGVVGFYGWPVGPSRNDTPAPAEMTAPMDLTGPGDLRRSGPGHPGLGRSPSSMGRWRAPASSTRS